MTNKLIIAVAAIAVSSASAAALSVMYTQMVGNVEHLAPATETSSGVAPVKSAVILNASESFGSFANSSGDDDVPACSGADEIHGCVVVARSSDTRANILGYGSIMPPIWLGRDSRDSFDGRAALSLLSSFDAPFLTELTAFAPQSNDETAGASGTGNGSNSNSWNTTLTSRTSGSSWSSTSFGFGYPSDIEFRAATDGISNAVQLSAYILPVPVGVATPEPATWAMILVGFAGLGYAWYQRSRATAT